MFKRTHFKLASLFIASVGFTLAFASPRAADAKEVISATDCLIEGDWTSDYLVNGSGVSNRSPWSGAPRKLYCHVPTFIREVLTGPIYLDGRDGNPGTSWDDD